LTEAVIGMKSRKSFLLRIPSELYDAVEAWAQQELRSVNGQIEYILKDAVRKRGHKPTEPKTSESPNAPEADV